MMRKKPSLNYNVYGRLLLLPMKTPRPFMIAYAYYSSPWEMKTGDDIRIHSILATLSTNYRVIVFNLANTHATYHIVHKAGVTYIAFPRRFYQTVSRLIRWKNHSDLNQLQKITHYVDEFLALKKIRHELSKSDLVLIFGSMTLASSFLRLLRARSTIIYDPLANYAQTLYLRSRRSVVELLKYAIYVALHKLQIKTSDMVIYPSHYDLNNGKYMFQPKKATVIPNPAPICYNSLEEFQQFRKRRDEEKPYVVLLAGGRVKANEEAVKTTIEIFNKLRSDYKLIITGPWNDYKNYVNNRNIDIVGVVPHDRLKEILAIADYGLSPIFSHAAGTFLKMLAYQAADLYVIASPHSLLGLDIRNPRRIRVVRNYTEFANAVEEILRNHKPDQQRSPLLCKDRDHAFRAQVEEAIRQL